MSEIFVSVDIEADGPIPGPFSMISLGAAAFKDDKLFDSFEKNLLPLKEATQDPDTMRFWARNQEAWDYCNANQKDPQEVMFQFSKWLQRLGGSPVFVGYPACYDWMFVNWYLIYFTGTSPFGISGLDMKTYTSAALGAPFKSTTKKSMPKAWFRESQHNHTALQDAIGQGVLFLRMRQYALEAAQYTRL